MTSTKKVQAFYKTRKGLIAKIYEGQKSSSKRRGHKPPEYSLNELREWVFNDPRYENMFLTWEADNYNKWLQPSIDRLDDSKGYSLDNIQLVTWKVNRTKQNIIQETPVNQFNKDGMFIQTYPSISLAAKAMGVHERNISWAVAGRYKTSCGYVWEKVNNTG